MFEIVLRDWKMIGSMVKTCEALCNQSDTVMLKVKQKGVYIMLTDVESFCCAEVRISNVHCKITKQFATVKILFDSFIGILRCIAKNKNGAVIFMDESEPYVLKIHQVAGTVAIKDFKGLTKESKDSKEMKDSKESKEIKEIKDIEEFKESKIKIIDTQRVQSAESRARVYYLISSQMFRKSAANEYVHFRIPGAEFNRIITTMCIISGNSGGVGNVDVVPGESDRVSIRFYVVNGGGMRGGITVHTHKGAQSVPLIHTSSTPIHIKYLVTYLKRSQSLFQCETVTMYISKQGILLQTDEHDNHSVLMFLANVSNEDLNSYA